MNYDMFIKKIDELSNKKMWMIITFMFLLNIIIRSLFVINPRCAYVTPDELIYLNMAKSLSYYGTLSVHNLTTTNMAILYPILISPIMLIDNPVLRITTIGIYNSILMTSTIFPVYFLSKKILNRNSISILLVFNVLLLPDMTSNMTFMAENIFYPLSAWLFVCVYQFIIKKSSNQKLFYCIISSVLCNFLYMAKIVSLYYVVALSIMLIIDILFFKYRKHVVYLLGFIISFFIFRKFIDIFIYQKVFHILDISNKINPTSFSISKLFFYVYCCVINLICSILAFFYFPVLLPIYKFKNLSDELKRLFIFALSSLITVIGTIAYLININEQFGALALRQHIRYYAPLLILFLLIFYFVLFDLKSKVTMDVNFYKNIVRILVISFLIILMFVAFFQLFYGVCIDGVLLEYVYYIYRKYVVLHNDYLVPFEIIIKIVISVLILIGTLIYIYNKKNAKKIMVVMILLVCMINNYCSIKSFKNDYGYNDQKIVDKINQIKKLDGYVKDKEGNILIITQGYNMLFESYFIHKAYYTSTEQALAQISGKDYIDIKTDKIVCSYPQVEYIDLTSIDYIITDKSIDLNNVENITVNDVKDYDLYYNSSEKLTYSIKSSFPTFVGQSKELNASSNIFSNFSKNNEGKFISTSDFSNGNVLVYGPYDYIKSGEYDITFYYDYSGNLEQGKDIGMADINITDINSVVSQVPIKAGEDKASIHVILPENYKSAETRLHSYVEGITFNKIVIQKVK